MEEIEVGKRYYFMIHVYHHFIGEVVAITGKRSCIIKHVRRIQSSKRSWTEFFEKGAGTKDDTVWTVWPDNTPINGWFAAPPWIHPIPGEPK